MATYDPLEVLEAPATATVAPLVASRTSEKELLGDVTGRALRALVVQLDRLEYRQAKFKGVGDVTRHEMAQEAATLARAVSQITDAVRKRESSVREMVANMTPEQRDRLVKAYIEALPPDQLKEWKEWIDGL